MLPFIAFLLAALGVVVLLVLAWWGLPLLLIAGVLLAMHVMASRKTAGPDAGAIERGRRTEPTGVPRKPSSSDAKTANERVGQG